MAALDFPASPTVGEAYGRWYWDGEKWLVVANGGGGVATPAVALRVQSVAGNFPTGLWQTKPLADFITETGGWVKNQSGDGVVVPSDGWYLVTLGIRTDAADIGRLILSIEGSTETGWVQEGSDQRSNSSRVVRYSAGDTIIPYFYNRGVALDGAMELSVAKITGEGGGSGGSTIVVPPPQLAQGVFIDLSPIECWYRLDGNVCEFYCFAYATASGLTAGLLEFDLPAAMPDMLAPAGTGNPNDFHGTFTHMGKVAPVYGKVDSARTVSVDNTVTVIQVTEANPVGILGKYKYA